MQTRSLQWPICAHIWTVVRGPGMARELVTTSRYVQLLAVRRILTLSQAAPFGRLHSINRLLVAEENFSSTWCSSEAVPLSQGVSILSKVKIPSFYFNPITNPFPPQSMSVSLELYVLRRIMPVVARSCLYHGARVAVCHAGDFWRRKTLGGLVTWTAGYPAALVSTGREWKCT